jgi:hypothetical protein
MKIIKSYLLCTLILPVLVLAAEKNEKKAPPVAKTPTSNPATVMAKVDGKTLTWGDFELLKKFSGFSGQDERLINLWKLNTYMAEKVRKEKFESDPKIKGLLSIVSDQVLVSLYIRYNQMNTTVTKEDLKKYYEEHKTDREFRELDSITAKIIAVDKDKKAELDQIKKQLVEGGNFDKLAEENREQTLKVTGLKDIEIKNVPGMDLTRTLGPAVAYSMAGVPLNEVKGPQAINNNNWILYKVTARTPGKQVPFEKISADLEKMLLRKKKAEVSTKLTEEAEKALGIKLEKQQPQQGGMRRPPRMGR